MNIYECLRSTMLLIGVHQRPGDLEVNVCKTKALTNMRAAGSDDMTRVVPPLELNLDIAVEYIQVFRTFYALLILCVLIYL